MIAIRAHQTVLARTVIATCGPKEELAMAGVMTVVQEGYLWKTIVSDDVGLDFMAELESDGWETSIGGGHGYSNMFAMKTFVVNGRTSVDIRVFAWPGVDHLDEILLIAPRIHFPPPA